MLNEMLNKLLKISESHSDHNRKDAPEQPPISNKRNSTTRKTTMTNQAASIDQIKAELDDGFELGKIKRDNVLRHSRGWVSSIVDFVLIALPLVAPIPNLLNLRVAMAPIMGWGASTLAAISFELLLFGSAEIILFLQDKHMRDGGYKWPLRIAVGCGAAFVAILMVLIICYEVPLHGWGVTVLPLVSLISVAFLSLKRYVDIRDSIAKDRAQYEDALTMAQSQVAELTVEMDTQRRSHARELAQLRRNLEKAKRGQMADTSPNGRINTSNMPATNASKNNGQILSADTQADNDFQNKRAEVNRQRTVDATQRRQALFELLQAQYDGIPTEELNKSALSQAIGASSRTIGRDLDALQNDGRLSLLNGVVKVEEGGNL